MNAQEERAVSRLHEPLSRDPGPVLSAFVSALLAGFSLLDLRAAQRATALSTARGPWLGEWATLYGYARGDRDDAALLAEMQTQTLLERRKTTHAGVAAACTAALGLPVSVTSGEGRALSFDDLEALEDGRHGLDYSSLDDAGEPIWDNVPETHHGARGSLPWDGEFGPSALWVTVQGAYTPEREAALLRVLNEGVKAGASFTLGWAVTTARTVRDTLAVAAEAEHPPIGWGIDSWGGSTWS